MKQFRTYSLAIAALFTLSAAAQTSFPSAESILYEAPEGTAYDNQARSATSFYDPGEGYGCLDSVSFYTADYVVADNGDVYLKNPFTFFPTDTWLKLDQTGDGELVAHLPQAMFVDEDGTVFYARRLAFTELDGETQTYQPDENQTDVRFTLRGDTLTMAGGETNPQGMPSTILGLSTATGGWSCYGESQLTIVPLGYHPTERPERVPADVHNFAYKDLYQSDAEVALISVRDGDKLYWELPYVSYNDEHYWVEGELTDEGLTVKPQYVGVDSWSCLHLFATPAQYDPESFSDEPYDLLPELTLRHSADDAGYVSDDELQTLLVNVGDEKVYFADAYHAPKLLAMPSTGALPNPKPYVVKGEDGSKGFQSVRFEFEPFDVNGDNTLTKDNLFYRVFVDSPDAPYVFRPQTYKGLEKEMTDIPYYFTDRSDIMYDGGGMTAGNIKYEVHQFNLYQPFDSVGVQTVYKGAVTTQSDIVWTTGSVTAAVATPHRQPTTTPQWYNLNGTRMTRPTRKGVIIRRNSDGTVTKEVVK